MIIIELANVSFYAFFKTPSSNIPDYSHCYTIGTYYTTCQLLRLWAVNVPFSTSFR